MEPATEPTKRIEHALHEALRLGDQADAPPGLAAALRDALFPGGSRLRPKLCIAVAAACGAPASLTADAAAASIELLHCASLVHDDLPCFDDAELRRGRPAIHVAHGEQLALLCGDALIVLAFENLAAAAPEPARACALVRLLARSVGMADGLCAGQAWECEPEVAVSRYHRAKTGALFAAATEAGAIAAGATSRPWRALGEKLGEAYQVADDLKDVLASAEEVGKTTHRDAALGRPTAVAELGAKCALKRLRSLVDDALFAIPDCPGAQSLTALIEQQAAAFLPPDLCRRVA
jgi:geranylgeranyl diphosphate synthase type II